jgi:brefeldin A-inhibited guanine nucleotide-exchange protein
MYAYIDLFDFSGMNIIQALRHLIDVFRPPGESQKVDRIMEKFASRYCECNTGGIFKTADAAYILSYSMFMLATDLHSNQVRKKMTKQDFINMNRGINDTNDLPDELLNEIYDDIAACELKMKAGAIRRPKFGSFFLSSLLFNRLDAVNASYRQRKLFQTLELESIAQTAHGKLWLSYKKL